MDITFGAPASLYCKPVKLKAQIEELAERFPSRHYDVNIKGLCAEVIVTEYEVQRVHSLPCVVNNKMIMTVTDFLAEELKP